MTMRAQFRRGSSLAEEFDLPVGIHLGAGPPAVAYESSPVPVKSPKFRMAAGDPLLLEDVLLRHKRLMAGRWSARPPAS